MEKVGGCKKSIGVGGKKLNKKRRCARAREFPCVYQRKYLRQFKSMACLNLQQTESVAYQFENEKKYERKVKKEKRKSEKEKVRG